MTSHQIRGWAAAGVVAGALVAEGCGSQDEVATSSAATTTATRTPTKTTAKVTAGVPALVRGHFKRRLTDADWKPVGGGFPVGTWRLEVDAAGTVHVFSPGVANPDFNTQFLVKGQALTIDSVPVCPGQTGRYRWHASAHTLRITLVADRTCEPRVALFDGTWTRD